MSIVNKLMDLVEQLWLIDFALTAQIREFGISIFRKIFDASTVQAIHLNIYGVSVFGTYLMTVFAISNGTSLMYQINSIAAILVNSILVIVLKLLFRHIRPTRFRLGFQAIFPDSFSFPSGNSACAVLLAYRCLYHDQWRNIGTAIGFVCSSLLIVFVNICFGQQYLFDVLAGALLGLLEGWIITNYTLITPLKNVKTFTIDHDDILSATSARIWKRAHSIVIIGGLLRWMTIYFLYREFINNA